MTHPGQPRTRTELAAAARVRRIRRSLAIDIHNARDDAGLSSRRLASAAGVSASTLREIEAGRSEPSLQVLARVGEALGMDLSVRFYPGSGPLVRDHIQASMVEALLSIMHERWQPFPEVWITRPIKGVIDVLLQSDTEAEPLVATEAQSELRRLEQQIRWAHAKSEALAEARARPISQVLLLRNTRHTRAVVAQHSQTLRAAYPARSEDAMTALATPSAWPGASIIWADVTDGHARLRPNQPRGITVGR